MIATIQPVLEQTALRPIGQAPPGWGEAIALLFLAAVILAVAPTVLMSVIGAVTGAVIPNARPRKGFWIGAGVGILTTIACFLFIWLLTLVERADWFDVNASHILAGVAVLVVFGAVASVWLIWRLQIPAGYDTR